MQGDLNKSGDALAQTSGFSAQDFRAALGLFATGVTIVTALAPDGQAVGLTVNSFNSVSLAPPLVLWSLGLRAGSLPVFTACSHYNIHILGADQRALAERFASRTADRFAGVAWRPGLAGVPFIDGCAAVFECRNHRRHEEGDHVIFVGEVLHCSAPATTATTAAKPGTTPLIFHGGRFYTELPL
jgi:flavin reductase (DIM6/NTAB) family NADH-FMN oxidoreductase RutF